MSEGSSFTGPAYNRNYNHGFLWPSESEFLANQVRFYIVPPPVSTRATTIHIGTQLNGLKTFEPTYDVVFCDLTSVIKELEG